VLLYTDVEKIHHACKTQSKRRNETATGYPATCWKITSLISLLCPVRPPQNRVIVCHFSEAPLSFLYNHLFARVYFDCSLKYKLDSIRSIRCSKRILPMSSTRGSTKPSTERGNDPVLGDWGDWRENLNLIPGLGPTSLSPPPSIYTVAGPLREAHILKSLQTSTTLRPCLQAVLRHPRRIYPG
jgi:hypothetical protein